MDKKIRVKDRPNIEEEMHRLFSGFAQMRNRILLHALNIWHPATDVCETDDELWIICELAGVAKENIKIHIEENIMTISGIRVEQKVGEKAVYHNLEINYGPFERNIQLPPRFVGSEPKATFANGFLKIRIPVSDEKPCNEIEVEVT